MTQIFNKKYQTPLRRRLRREMPKGEKLLWMYLRNSQLRFKFRRQVGIGRFVADFYCPKLRFAIEVDGLSHQNEVAAQKDRARDVYFEQLGITTKRYTSHQVFESLDVVKEDIYNTCLELRGGAQPPPTPPS